MDSNPTRNESFLFLGSGKKIKRDVEFHHSTHYVCKIERKVRNGISAYPVICKI